MAFRDRLKVRAKEPTQADIGNSFPVSLFGFQGVDWVKILAAANGALIMRLQDPSGNILSINPNGSVDVNLVSHSMDLATATKQEDLKTQFTDLLSRIGQGAVPDPDTVLQKLNELSAKLDLLITSSELSASPIIIEAETVATSVTPIGTVVTLPWFQKSLIQKMTVLLESGATPDYRFEILRSPVVTERNIIVRHDVKSPDIPRFDLLQTVPMVNLLGLSELYVRVVPSVGTSNNFFISISGIEAK